MVVAGRSERKEKRKTSIHPLTMTDLTELQSDTSNGGCRREEKSCKHWSLFTKLLSSIPAFFLFIRSNQEQLYILIALKIRKK